MDQRLQQDLLETGYLHFPLPLHTEDSLEASLERKPVQAERVLWQNGDLSGWRFTGRGSRELAPTGRCGDNAIRLRIDSCYDSFPEGTPLWGRYAAYGDALVTLGLSGEDWTAYNRLSCWIKPDYEANDYVNLVLGFRSEGAVKVPDRYHREGYHVMNLKNHEWNHVIWEFQTCDRDKVTELFFRAGSRGHNGAIGRELLYDICDIRLQTVERPDYALGWQGAPDTILYATAGYALRGAKTAISTAAADAFALVRADTGETAFTAPTRRVENGKGLFYVLDFTACTTPGQYRLQCGAAQSEPFAIDERVFDSAVWKSINFLFCQRCGYPVGNIHGGCHHDIYGEHEGRKIILNGGWHDAGDKSQQVVQTAEVAQAMFVLSELVEDDTMLSARLLEEANWGLDYALRTRFGDGFRLLDYSGIRFSNGIIGDFDDTPNCRGGRRPLENFILAGVEADAARVMRTRRLRGRAQASLDAAEEDFAFAVEDYEAHGYTPFGDPSCHTLSASHAQFLASASYSASLLYRATGNDKYAAYARSYADDMLLCQETGEAGLPLKGMFYRNREHSAFVHYNHQSREHAFAVALIALAQTQKDHPDRSRWEAALGLYGQYIKDLMAYAAPYGMIPAGVYRAAEAEDEALYNIMQLVGDYAGEKGNFAAMVKNGAHIGEDAYVRCFPVWISHRGNAAVHLSSGRAAAAIGKYFGDEELMSIGREQIYWLLGKNPFGQSIMYGEGKRYQWQYASSSGDMVGELPVGVMSFRNEDVPYWPQGNNAVYKEVWTSTTGRFLDLLSELY